MEKMFKIELIAFKKMPILSVSESKWDEFS